MIERAPEIEGLSIESFHASDLDEIMEIEAVSFTAPWSRQSYEELIPLDSVIVWVAKIHGELVGYVLVQYVGSEMEIHTFAVKPTWRRMGIGRRFIGHVLAKAREHNVKFIYLLVRPSNEPARRLYEEFGFEKVGLRTKYYHDNREDALILRLTL